MALNTGVGPQYQLSFAYDAQGRRIQKSVVSNSVALYTDNFLYDGWNLVAILNPPSTVVESFLWGNDLSGSPQGAGGVGGLLEVSYNGSTTTNCFPAFDGNGNVAALVNAANGTLVANYEYGPFGEVIRATGPMAKMNPLRFSTKYNDDESDLLYYGYRYYKPSTGTWDNRDPMISLSPIFDDIDVEHPSATLEGAPLLFVNNNAVASYDGFGLWPSSHDIGGLIIGLNLPLTHQNSIERAIPGLTREEYDILDRATREVDEDQSVGNSFMHAMRAGAHNGKPEQSIEDAKTEANAFVTEHLNMARILLCPCAPDRTEALHQFGLALHTIQDATSPAHTGFQVWNGIKGHWLEALAHIHKEDYDPGATSQLDKATAWFWTFFRCPLFGGPTPPSDFFANLGSDPVAPSPGPL
jgi:RHS repeat-associated protein